MNEIITKIIRELQNKHDCHTVILIGSRARDDATPNSDYDVVGIREEGEDICDCRDFEESYLDAFIFSDNAIKNLDPYFIRIRDGIVLLQKDSIGDNFIAAAKELYAKGPSKTPDFEKQRIIAWRKKMLNRSLGSDVESHFRLHWVLHDSLECYFKLRDQWYMGPKESFKWLSENDFVAYIAFRDALKPGAELTEIKHLIKIVNGYKG